MENIQMKDNIMNAQQIVSELADRINRETTEEQKAYLSGEASPAGKKTRFFDWHGYIDNLNLSGGGDSWISGEMAAKLRSAMHQIADLTRRVGGRTVAIGKRIMEFIATLLESYPMTIAALVVLAVLDYFVGAIPFLGVVLVPIINTAGLMMVGLVFCGECFHNLRYALHANH